jgi:hypothetical protein
LDEIRASRKIRRYFYDIFNDPGNPKPNARKFDVDEIMSGIEALREAEGDVKRLPNNTLPEPLLELKDEIENGTLRLNTNNILDLASELLNGLGRVRYMSEALDGIRGQLKTLNSAKNKKDVPAPRRAALKQAIDVTESYMDGLTHRNDYTTATVAKHFGGLSKALQKAGLIRGDELSKQDVERLSMMMTSWYGGVAMSWRAALAFRNAFQPFLLGPKLGYGNVLGGYKDAIAAMFNGNWKKLLDEGLIREQPLYGFSTVAGTRVGGTMFQAQAGPGVSPVRELVTQGMETSERAMRQFQSVGLWAYRSQDAFNRVTSYYASQRAMKGAFKHLETGGKDAVDDFKMESGLLGDSQTVQRNVMRLVNKGMRDEAADYYGKHNSRTSQFIYSKTNAPKMFQNVYGRAFGQFGIWPMGYWEYLANNMGGQRGVFAGGTSANFKWLKQAWSKEARGKYARTPDERYRARFTGRYLAQLAAFATFGAITGINVSTYNKANPLAYEGGPAKQLISDLIDLGAGTGSGFQNDMALSSVKRFLLQMVNPAGGMTNDIRQGLRRLDRGDNPLEVLLEFLAFNMDTTPTGK